MMQERTAWADWGYPHVSNRYTVEHNHVNCVMWKYTCYKIHCHKPPTQMYVMCDHTHSHDKMIVTYGANEQTTHLHLRLNLYLLLDTSVSGLP